MSDYDPNIPTRRGRRDPELQAQLDAEGTMLGDDQNMVGEDQGEAPGVADYALMPGDVVMAKTTLAYPTATGDAWSTFGAQTHVMQGETVDDTFERLSVIVNSGVIELSKDAVDRVAEEAQPQRITPRR